MGFILGYFVIEKVTQSRKIGGGKVPGKLELIFYENVTESEANNTVEKIGNLYNDDIVIEHRSTALSRIHFIVRVPEGKEEFYVKIFKQEPTIKDAYWLDYK